MSTSGRAIAPADVILEHEVPTLWVPGVEGYPGVPIEVVAYVQVVATRSWVNG